MIDLQEFKNPSSFFRVAPFWSWNDKLNEEELLRQIDEMHKVGYGGFFMHSRVGLVTEYLSDEWMNLVKKCAEYASKLGMLAWLYDEDKWPSGFAGGLVPLKDPKFRHKFLAVVKKQQLEQDDEVLDSYIDPKTNEEYFIVKRTMQLGDKWFNGTCYVDLLSKETTLEFIKVTHEEYKKVCGSYFGNAVPGIFTDEPMYLRVHYKDIPTLPWTDKLPERFLEQKGYDIKDHLKELFFDVEDYQKVRFDFFDIATAMFIENFTIPYSKWCEENGIKMTGHFMAEDTMRGQIEWIGAAMPHYEYMQLPGIDKLARHLEQTVTIKQVSSVAEQLGKEGVLCETFGTTGQHVSFLHRKWISDWQAVLGVTYINPHLSLYSMRGERKRDYPPNLFYQQPWWEDEKYFADYLARLCYVSNAGKRDVEVLLIHPISSAWSLYSKFDDSVDKLDMLLDRTVKELISQKIDFHFGDEIILSKYAKVENGKFVVGRHEYSAIVIPPCTNLRSKTIEILKSFLETGGRVIILDDFLFKRFYLHRIDGKVCTTAILENADFARDLDELVNKLKAHLPNLIEVIDKKSEKNAKSIILQKRNLDSNTSVVLIANTDIKREVHAKIKIPDLKNVYAIDLFDFGVFSIPTLRKLENWREIDAVFYPSSSLCLLITAQELSVGSKNLISTGVLFESHLEYQTSSTEFEIELKNFNTLILDKVTYEVEGKKLFENVHISKLWHSYFYNLPDGTRFKATYSFEVEAIPERLFAVIECAENLDKILVNGNEVKFRKFSNKFESTQNYLDVNFGKIEITPFVKMGKNEIVIEGKKCNNITAPGCHERVKDAKAHRPTELEAIYLLGDFSLINVDDTRFIITKVKKPNHLDITKDGYPFYIGSVSLKSTFALNKQEAKRYYLKLNGLEAASAKVYVNKKFCSILCWEPFMLDITEFIKDGKNELEIVITNTLFNLIEANNKADVLDELFRRPQSFIDFEHQTEKYILLPFGLASYSILTSEV